MRIICRIDFLSGVRAAWRLLKKMARDDPVPGIFVEILRYLVPETPTGHEE